MTNENVNSSDPRRRLRLTLLELEALIIFTKACAESKRNSPHGFWDCE